MGDSPDPSPDVPEATSEAISAAVPWDAPPEPGPTDAIELWTPAGIGWASVLVGFPGGTVLAALNWRRLDRTRKAVIHLAAAALGTLAIFFVDTRGLALLFGIAISYYLFRVQRADQAPLRSAGRVTERNGLAGAVIAIGASILFFGSTALIVVATSNAAVAHSGVVTFGTRAGSDVCSSAGPGTVFGPSDSIFWSAVMRETVQKGSKVVLEIDGPGGQTESVPITAEPPYDCLGTKNATGPFEPGTFTIRYRYADRPSALDLATGSFTVTTGLPSPS